MDVSQYLDIFIDETNEHIQALTDNIMILENEPENKDVINEIFRAAHSLKGMAGTMGFKKMQTLTHDMENLFQEVRNDNVKVNSSLIDILFSCLDAIQDYLETIKATSDEGDNANEALIKQLNDFLVAAEGDEVAPETASETKAEESAEEVESKDKFREIDVDDITLSKLHEAEDAGQALFGVTVHIQKDCLLKAARAFLVFKAIEDYGEILVYSPSSQDIEDEKFDLDFSLIVTSQVSLDQIVGAVNSVSEIASVDAAIVSYLDYAKGADNVEEAPKTESSAEEDTPVSTPVPAQSADATAAPATTTSNKKSAKTQTNNKPVTARTVRVDIEKLDSLMNQVSELIIAKNSLVSISNSDVSNDFSGQSFRDQIEYLERITTNLHESVMKVRMVPIENTVNKFPRMIRDLSRKLGKPMDLVMTGEETELDRTVVDQIGDPLQHLLRNSADHGIEAPEVRRKLGKPEKGTINLNAYQEGNNVIIEVKDDGAGIDTENVKAKAIERGIVTEEQAENLTKKEIIDFLFMPSFSMAKEITDISGRGVGLDVVKSNIEALGGDVEVKSVMGEGSTFTVRLPLSLAIIQALMVEVCDEKYAIALGSITNIESISVNDIKYVQTAEVIHLRGSVIPIVRLDKLLDAPSKEDGENLTVVVVKKGDNLAGLVVDNLIGQQEIVIKSLGKCIDNNKLISGATILGDGEVALILDVNAIF